MTANRNTIRCPHCEGRVRTQTSRPLSALVREIYFACVDVDCGHQFVAQLGIVRTTVPSMMPRPDVSLPIVDRRANDIIVPGAAPVAAPTPTATPSAAAPAAPPANRPAPSMVLN